MATAHTSAKRSKSRRLLLTNLPAAIFGDQRIKVQEEKEFPLSGSTPAYPKSSEEVMKVAAGAPSVKVGTPPDDELYELAFAIADIWKKLGHCLGVSEEVLHSIDQDFAMLSNKGYHMLIHWKRGATASYKVLNDALRHEDVQRQDLAEKFCQGGHKMEFPLSGSTPAYPKSSEEVMKVAAGAPSVKVGTPPDDELYELAFAIADIWKKLGHCLGVSEEVLHSIDQDFAMLSKKGYHMLIYWKRGATASYKVLNDALRHEDVQRQDLAEKFCQGGHKMEKH